MASGPGDGDPVQSHSAGEHGRRAAGEVARVPAPGPLRQSLPHQRLRQGVGPLPGQLHQQPRYITLFHPRTYISSTHQVTQPNLGLRSFST